MTQTEEKILDKIKKLLALADEKKAGTPEEAATAAAKVQELLQKYNLDQSLLYKDSPKHRMRVCEIGLPNKRLWTKNLLWTLAYFNFCKALWYTHTPKAYLLGEETNIEAVLALYGYLGNALTTMAEVHHAQYIKNCKTLHKHPVDARTYKANFFEGAVNAITYRLDKQQKEFAASSNTGMALIVVNFEELEAFRTEKFPEVQQVKTMNTRDVDGAGFRAGFKAGMEVELHKLVKEG